MKIRNKRVIVFLLFLLCNFYCIELYGQDSYLKNRWNIKLSYAPYPTGGIMYGGNDKPKSKITTDIRLEGNYGILNFLETGIYMGYSPFKDLVDFSNTFIDTSGQVHNAIHHPYGHFLSYGLNANVHFLPFFIQKDSRIDFYFTAKYGGRSSLVSKGNRYRHDLGFGLGFAFYFSKNIGLHTEWLLTKGLFDKPSSSSFYQVSKSPFFFEKSTFRVGFTVKFKPNANGNENKK